MSTFTALIHRIAVEPHPDADRLDLARIGGYLSVIGKDSMKTGDLGAYIPEAALVPIELQRELGVEGLLSGSKKDRVKAIKLRGILSQGLVLPVVDGCVRGHKVAEGDDVTELLGLRKYVPPVPSSMEGAADPLYDYTVGFDVEDIKKYPDVLQAMSRCN